MKNWQLTTTVPRHELIVTAHRQVIPQYLLDHIVYAASTQELLALSELIDAVLKNETP